MAVRLVRVSLPPAAFFVPVQPPEAVHEVALLVTHVRVVLPPLVTLVGLAVSVKVGAGGGVLCTVTVAEREMFPPEPVQARV